MYVNPNFKTKKAFKEAVAAWKLKRDDAIAAGKEPPPGIAPYQPGLGTVPINGTGAVEGPHYPAPHTWYASVKIENGYVVSVK